MNEAKTVKVSLAVSSGLLKAVDDLAKRDFASRSEIFRLAILQFINRPDNTPPTPQAVLEVLAAEQLKTLRSYQKGRLTFKQLVEAGITVEMQMELMKLGEL